MFYESEICLRNMCSKCCSRQLTPFKCNHNKTLKQLNSKCKFCDEKIYLNCEDKLCINCCKIQLNSNCKAKNDPYDIGSKLFINKDDIQTWQEKMLLSIPQISDNILKGKYSWMLPNDKIKFSEFFIELNKNLQLKLRSGLIIRIICIEAKIDYIRILYDSNISFHK